MVAYLETLGHEPSKIKNSDYWYLSPLRKEDTPSFKINQKLNVWYDHAIGKGGNLVDFGIAYFRCSVSEFLQLLNGNTISSGVGFPINDNNRQSVSPIGAREKYIHFDRIIIIDVRTLESKQLLDYLEKRGIGMELAKQHCKEVDFSLNNRKQTVIGFENVSGGYELRGEKFKGSSSPKDITFIDTQNKSVAVFEGFFDYLSFMEMNQKSDKLQTNFLILNSLSFFNKSLELMDRHRKVNLFLDRDTVGIKCTQEALQRQPEKYVDQSFLYQQKKDLSEWLEQTKSVKKSTGFRTSL
ncbi:DNA primase [compost metagenome]